jgi:hypothetical protein
MVRLLAVLTLLGLPLAAQAQMASYCSGGVVADLFDTRVTQGSATRASYAVTLRNTQSAARRVQVNVTASVLDRPNGAPITINPGQRLTVQLGYQTILPGSQALRGEQLANVTRVSCV